MITYQCLPECVRQIRGEDVRCLLKHGHGERLGAITRTCDTTGVDTEVGVCGCWEKDRSRPITYKKACPFLHTWTTVPSRALIRGPVTRLSFNSDVAPSETAKFAADRRMKRIAPTTARMR